MGRLIYFELPNKKEIIIQPLNGDNLGIFSLDPLDQD